MLFRSHDLRVLIRLIERFGKEGEARCEGKTDAGTPDSVEVSPAFNGSSSAVCRVSAPAPTGSPIGSRPLAERRPWRAQGRVGKAMKAGCLNAPRARQYVGQRAKHPRWTPSTCPEAGNHPVLAPALGVAASRWWILHHVVLLLGSPVARYPQDQINPAIVETERRDPVLHQYGPPSLSPPASPDRNSRCSRTAS